MVSASLLIHTLLWGITHLVFASLKEFRSLPWTPRGPSNCFWDGVCYIFIPCLHNSLMMSRSTLMAPSEQVRKQEATRWPGLSQACMHIKSLESCPTLCDSMDCMYPTRLLYPWNFPGKNTGAGCLPSPGIFLTQGSNPHLFCLLLWQADSLSLSHLGSQIISRPPFKAKLHLPFSARITGFSVTSFAALILPAHCLEPKAAKL